MEKIHDKLTVQTNYCPVDIVKDMQVEYGVQISYQKLFRVKAVAYVEINSNFEEAQTLANIMQGPQKHES